MGYSKVLEVTNVSIATESSTGKKMYAVKFGEEIKVTPDLQKYLTSQSNMSKPPEVVYYDIAILYFNFDEAVPYKVGSKWKLKIENTGNISILPLK